MPPWFADAFRIYWSATPFLAAAAAFCVALAARRRWLGFLGCGDGVWTLASIVVVCAAGGHMLLYLFTPNFIDYAEPMISVVATNLLNGDQVYHDVYKGQSIVSSLYGPLVFVVQALSLAASPTVFGSKSPGIVAAATSIILIVIALRRAAPKDPATAWLGLAVVIAFLYAFRHFWFWNRPDPFLLLTASAAVVAFATLVPKHALIVIGALGGIAVNLKVHAPLYILPLAVTAYCNIPTWPSRLIAAGVACALGLVLCLLPFGMPQVGFAVYARNLVTISKHGLDVTLMVESIAYAAAFLAVPAMLLLFPPAGVVASRDRSLFWSLFSASIAMAVISSKPGAGAPHMLPFLPIAAFLTVRLLRETTIFKLEPIVALRALLVAELAIFLPIWSYSVYEIHKHFPDFSRERAAAAEARAFFLRYEGAEMAIGRDAEDPLVYHRVQGGFAGKVLRFDVVNWMDLRLAGVSGSLVQHFLEECRTPAWILPVRQAPFEAQGYGHLLFDGAFREAFRRNYTLKETGRFFGVWTCSYKELSERS